MTPRQTLIEPQDQVHGVSGSRVDRGFSFVETLVTVVLLSVVVVPVLEAVRTSIRASSIARSSARLETVLVNAADRLNRAPLSCDYTVYAQAAVQTEGWSPEQAWVDHEWYDPTTNEWRSDSDGCRFAAPTDDLVQKITVWVESADGRITRSVQVVKSRV